MPANSFGLAEGGKYEIYSNLVQKFNSIPNAQIANPLHNSFLFRLANPNQVKVRDYLRNHSIKVISDRF
jgi:hypothetical protein